MGSDKKRKRKESESALESAERPDKAERKRLKRLKKEKERAEREAASVSTEKKKVREKKRDKVDQIEGGEQDTPKRGTEGNGSSVKNKKTKRKDKEEEDVTMAENGSSFGKKKKKKKKDKEASKEKEHGVGKPDDEIPGKDVEAEGDIPSLVSPLATPLVEDELRNKILKLLGEAAKAKAIRRGIREVVWSIRKEDSGLCVLAADVHPIDVISHFPILCEDANIPYCYVSGRAALGTASLTRRPTSVVMVSMKNAKGEVKADLEVLAKEVKELHGGT